jgi:hypothetical protein
VSPSQAVAGAVAVVVLAIATAGALDLLVRRTPQRAPLGAPAQEEVDTTCPAPREGSAPVVVASDELIECPSTYDGVLVSYEGEAVRAVLDRGAHAWLHLNDDRYALDLGPLPEHRTAVGGNSGIPVLVPEAVADRVQIVGDGRHRGDIIAVTGVFRRAHPADGGGPAIRARSARVTQRGDVTARPIDGPRVVIAVIVCAAALLAALVAHPRQR